MTIPKTLGENPANFEWDFIQNVWNKGDLETGTMGSMRVQILGGAPLPSGEVAVRSDGITREPLHLDASYNLRVVISGPAGVPIDLPIYGVAPNEYLQVMEMAPVTGRHWTVPAVLADGDAVLALLDVNRRLDVNIGDFSSSTPVDVDVSGGSVFVGSNPIDSTSVAHIPGDYTYNPGAGANGASITGVLMKFSSAAAKTVTISVTDGVTTWIIDSITSDIRTQISWSPSNGKLELPQSCSLVITHTVNNMDVRVLGGIL